MQTDSLEEQELASLLRSKVDLMKRLIESVLEDSDPSARLNGAECRRVIDYAQRTFFKHLRLYDFVFKNAKTSEKKYIRLSKMVPQIGQSLGSAMVQDL